MAFINCSACLIKTNDYGYRDGLCSSCRVTRLQTKQALYALNYGMGPTKFQHQFYGLGVTTNWPKANPALTYLAIKQMVAQLNKAFGMGEPEELKEPDYPQNPCDIKEATIIVKDGETKII